MREKGAWLVEMNYNTILPSIDSAVKHYIENNPDEVSLQYI
jgi:hypothetical protein